MTPTPCPDCGEEFGTNRALKSHQNQAHVGDGAPWQDADRLRELYVKRGLSKQRISKIWDCSGTTIGKWLDRHGIEEISEPPEETPWRDGETLREMYVEEERSMEDIAQELGCGDTAVRRWLKKHDIPIRERHEKMVEATFQGPAYYFTGPDGYEQVAGGVDGSVDYVGIHRLVAMLEYGFDEVVGKVVHHKNGIPWDNRPENLEPVTRYEHYEIHKEDINAD